MESTRQQNWLRLQLTKGLGRVGLGRLIKAYGDAETALDHSRQHWRQHAGLTTTTIGDPPATDSPLFENTWQALLRCQARIISLWDDDYPALLATIHDPPALLYLRGQLPATMAIAIVGSRRCSSEGLRLAHDMAAELSRQQVTIVSGLARGIDTAAHRGAVAGAGSTVAVLGGGIDIVYPPENRNLFAQIAEQGAILSEYPPGTQPLSGHFPARNRIISGLSHGVLVIEAAAKSGSLLTANFALDQGRDVFAVPGSVYQPGCQGTLQLLKQGAMLVTEAEDILACYPFQPRHATAIPSASAAAPAAACPVGYDLSQLSAAQKKLFEQLRPTPLHLDQLAQECGLTAMEVSAIVLHLELEGLASALPGGRYIRGSAA